jgi:large subunit ribosomal protein L17
MKHRVAGRKLGRTSAHRLALLRNLATALLDKEQIKTTLMKAKELRPFVEKLITISKRETLHARRQVLRHVHDREVVGKLFATISARFAQRPGGYTRIIKLGPRRGDAAEMALIELVGSETVRAKKKKKPEAKGKPARQAAPEKEAPAKTEEAEGPVKKAKKEAGKPKAKPEAKARKKEEKPPAKKAADKKAADETLKRAGGAAAKRTTRKTTKGQD